MNRPNITIPTSFGGVKADFDNNHLTNGFPQLTPDVLPGDCLNKFIDDTYKGLNGVLELYEGCVLYDSTVTYTNKSLVFDITNDGIKFYHSLQNGNINHALTDTDYWEEVNLGGSSRNVGEIIPSALPLTDAGLHLLDGTRLSGDGIYGEFVQYIADLYEETPYSWIDYTQPTNPNGITSSSGFSNPSNAFDNNSSTYASCATTTDYIEWDLGQTLKVSGFNATIQWVSGSAASCNLAIYSVDDNNNETLIANGSGVAGGASGTSSANFSGIEVNKLRFKIIANDAGNVPTSSTPSRIVQINIIAQREVKPIFCTEAEWQQSVATYGVCGKFVYDSTNNTVRLPKITGVVEGTTDLTALGDLVEAGLPNITGNVNWKDGGQGHTEVMSSSGALYKDNQANVTYPSSGGTSTNYRGFSIDASLSSSIYGNSTTVQPQTIKVLYYIVIATSSKTDIQVDIDEVATDLNGKADRDLINLTNGLANTICSTTATTTSSASSARPAVVIENYVNGTSWYRVWSDGWIEQGGTASKDTTVTFLKPFSNSDYSLVISYYRPNNETAEYVVSAKNYNNFRTKSNVGNADPCYWMASGY